MSILRTIARWLGLVGAVSLVGVACATSTPPSDAYAQARPALWPIVGSPGKFAEPGDTHTNPKIPSRVIAGPLVVSLGVKQSVDTYVSVTAAMLKEWGTTFDEAFAVALANSEAANPTPFIKLDWPVVVWANERERTCDGSAILRTALVKTLEVEGRHVGVVVADDVAIVAGSDDPDALRAMLGAGRTARAQPHGIQAPVLILEGDQWVVWNPPPSHPLADEIRTWNVAVSATTYHDQTTLLRAELGTSIEVVDLALADRDDGFHAVVPVTLGGPSLLPRGELVAFESTGVTTWDRFVAVVGPALVHDPTFVPERWRFAGKLTPEQITSLELKPFSSYIRQAPSP